HEIFKFNISKTIGLQHVVEVVGDSRIALKGMRDGFFDVVYVDGAHGYDIVFQDITNAFRVCKRGGRICGADYDCSARMMRAIPGSARQLDEYVMPPSNVGVHPGVVLAVDALLGSPRLYSTFWAFSKLADRAEAPFRDSVAPLDVSAFPRRIPALL